MVDGAPFLMLGGSGGPTDNVLNIWKAAAPAVDLIGPDIYMGDSARYEKVLDLYHRSDKAMLVPETGSSPAYAPYFFATLGHEGIGFSPFGIHYTLFKSDPLGAPRLSEELLAPFALNYKLIEPIDREIALLNFHFQGKLKAVAEETDKPRQTLSFGDWNAEVSYGLPQFGFGKTPPGNPEPVGRAFVAQLSPIEFLVGGFFCRIDFSVTDPVSKRNANSYASKRARTKTVSSSPIASGMVIRRITESTSAPARNFLVSFSPLTSSPATLPGDLAVKR